MRVLPLLCLALLGLPATSNAGDPPEAARPVAATPDAGAAQTAAEPRKAPDRTITIDPNLRPPVCKRVVPTGSRIAEQRCESPADRATTTADDANRAILRRDIEAMRDQQMLREQARQAAMAEAMRRRAAGQ